MKLFIYLFFFFQRYVHPSLLSRNRYSFVAYEFILSSVSDMSPRVRVRHVKAARYPFPYFDASLFPLISRLKNEEDKEFEVHVVLV